MIDSSGFDETKNQNKGTENPSCDNLNCRLLAFIWKCIKCTKKKHLLNWTTSANLFVLKERRRCENNSCVFVCESCSLCQLKCVNPLPGWDALSKPLLWYFCLLKGLPFNATPPSTTSAPTAGGTRTEPLSPVHNITWEHIIGTQWQELGSDVMFLCTCVVFLSSL